MSRFFSDSLIESCCVLEKTGLILQNRKYYCGADISGMGEDLTTIEIFEKLGKDNLMQRDNIISKKVYTTDTSDKIIYLNEKYKFKKIGIDSNGVGFGVFSELLRHPRCKGKTEDMDSQRRPIDEDGERSATLFKEQMYFRLL